jgi:hypothetical protein
MNSPKAKQVAPVTPLKSSPKVNVPKKAESKPIVKKEAVTAKPLVKSEKTLPKKLTPTKNSDTIGDMENNKLIEPK